jgi:hypothetical protein
MEVQTSSTGAFEVIRVVQLLIYFAIFIFAIIFTYKLTIKLFKKK